MAASESEIVRRTLERPDVHSRWIGDFYNDESSRFYDAAFDRIAALLAPHGISAFLDAGCGDGAQSIRLAERGYPVVALDFSEYVLDRARENVTAHGLEHRVRFEHGSLLGLPFADGAFRFVLCWSVLMHIPEVEKAIAELARVVEENGFLVVSEDNMWSLESTLARLARRIVGNGVIRGLRGKEPAKLGMREAGAEYWRQTDAGPLLCREARISWLVAQFARHGLVLRKRMAGQFVERHASARHPWLKRALQRFNVYWFKHIRLAQPAMDNLLVLQKMRVAGPFKPSRHGPPGRARCTS